MGVARLRGCWKESLVSTARACASFSIKSTCVFIDDGVEFTSCINLCNARRVYVSRSYSSRNSISLAAKGVNINSGVRDLASCYSCLWRLMMGYHNTSCWASGDTREGIFLLYTARNAVTCSGLGLIPWFPVHSSAYFSALSNSSSSHIAELLSSRGVV